MSYNIALFCSNPVNGGTARVFYELANSLRERGGDGFTLRAAVNIDNPVEIYKKIEGLDRLKIYSEEEICTGMYGGNVVSRILKRIQRKIRYRSVKRVNIGTMVDYIRNNNIGCVIIHNGGYVGDDLCNQMLEAAYICRGITLCRVFVLHNDFQKNLFTKIRFFTYDKIISKEATDLVTVSDFTRNRIIDSSFISKNIRVIYNGLPVNNSLTVEEKKSNLKLDNTRKNILLLGNFMENKGQLEFLDSARIVCKKIADAFIIFIGNVYDEEYFKRCVDKINNYSLEDKTSILHDINNASEYIDLFDVVVVPSIYDESFGLIAVESMSKGTPVVAFACGGIPEVIEDGRDGYVVPIGDTTAMADRIIRILSDSKMAKRLGDYGRNVYMNRFSVDIMCERYYQLVKTRMQCMDDGD